MKFAYNLAQTLDVCIPGVGQFDNQLLFNGTSASLDFLHDIDRWKIEWISFVIVSYMDSITYELVLLLLLLLNKT